MFAPNKPQPYIPTSQVTQTGVNTDFSWLVHIKAGGDFVQIIEPTDEERARLANNGVIDSFYAVQCAVEEQYDVVALTEKETEELKKRLPEEAQDKAFAKLRYTLSTVLRPTVTDMLETQPVPVEFLVEKILPALKGQYRGIDVDPNTGYSEPLTRILKEAEAEAQLERDAFEAVMKQQAQAQQLAEEVPADEQAESVTKVTETENASAETADEQTQ